MERIAPLAKILAEANGIDWRNLRGSGEGGLIVEGDILGYLSRIMSGEEEPPATPVDAPPPEWTGTDLLPGAGLLAPGMPSMDMLSSAGVDSDLAALVGQPQLAAPAASLEEEALEFELEDEQVTAPPSLHPEYPSAAPSFPVPEVAAPLAAAPDFGAPTPVLGREGPSAPLGRAAGLAAAYQPEAAPAPVQAAPPPPTAPAAGGVMAGLGSLLSRLYQQPAAQPAPALAAPPVQAAPVPTLPGGEAPVVAAPVIEAPEVGAPAPEALAPEPEVQPGDHAGADVEPGEGAAPLPEREVPVVPVVEQPGVQVAEQRTAPGVDLAQPAAAAPAAPVLQPAQEDSRPREAVPFGTYLRRDANLAPAAELRRQLTAALGQDVPLALLVARAAQRHAESLGLGTVALHDLKAGRAQTVQPGSLRDALTALGSDHTGTPDLLVIDAGALDLDDLHLGHTVTLSVGRVQDGRASLSLNGDMDAAQAARFLASVAGTLEEPIILVI